MSCGDNSECILEECGWSDVRGEDDSDLVGEDAAQGTSGRMSGEDDRSSIEEE